MSKLSAADGLLLDSARAVVPDPPAGRSATGSFVVSYEQNPSHAVRFYLDDSGSLIGADEFHVQPTWLQVKPLGEVEFAYPRWLEEMAGSNPGSLGLLVCPAHGVPVGYPPCDH